MLIQERTAPAVSGPYYSWHGEGVPLSAEIRHAAMEAIQLDVQDAFQRIPKRGAETCGVLLGSRVIRNGRASLIVESAEPLPCEHRHGPSLVLSDRDREGIAERIRTLKAEGLAVIGFYRSVTSGAGLELDAADHEILTSYASEAASLFLLLNPLSMARIEGRLLFLREGRVSETGPVSPFPFGGMHAPVARSAERRSARPQFEVLSRATATTTPSEAGDFGAKPATGRFNRTLVWIAAMIAAALGAFWAGRLANGPLNEKADLVELAASMQDQTRVLLSWNGPDLLRREIRNAEIEIRDGDHRLHYNLDPTQVVGGKISYAATSGRVSFLFHARGPQGRGAQGALTLIDPAK